MSNSITNRKNYSHEEYSDKRLRMSNGLTDVLIQVLSINASHLAQTDAEIDFAIWIASHDQAIQGRGMVGFDLSALPWSIENFAAEKKFLLRVVDSAKAKHYWEMLSYKPKEETALRSLEQFRELIEDFTAEFISRDNSWLLLYKGGAISKPAKREKCLVHGIYLHEVGCVLCFDGSIL